MKKLLLMVLICLFVLPTFVNAGIIYKHNSWCLSDQAEVIMVSLDPISQRVIFIQFKGVPEPIYLTFINSRDAIESYGLIVNRVKWAR